MSDTAFTLLLVVERVKAHLKYTAKAILAVAVPVAVEGGFQLLESFDVASTPAPARLIIAALLTGLAVYRKKNGLKP